MSRMLWSGGARQENEDLPLRGIERELIDGRGRSRSTPGTGAGRGAGFRDRHADSSPSSSRHRGKSVRWPGCGGSVIRHAAAGAVGALTVAVVETSFRTALMTDVGGPNRPAPTGRPARRRAVGMTAVTRRADGEGTAALTAGSLAEGLVHGVGARGAISDWTTDPEPWHNSSDRLGLSELGAVTRVRLGYNRALTPTSESALYATRTQRWRPAPGPWTPSLPMDAKSAPTGSLENRQERGFPQRPQPSLFPLHQDPRKNGCPSRSGSMSVKNLSVFDDR